MNHLRHKLIPTGWLCVCGGGGLFLVLFFCLFFRGELKKTYGRENLRADLSKLRMDVIWKKKKKGIPKLERYFSKYWLKDRSGRI